MSRLINLDAAVDVVAKWFENIGLNGDICLDGLRSLPSAQPKQLDRCPIYRGVCGYPSDECYDCPRHDPTRIANKLMMPELHREEGDS